RGKLAHGASCFRFDHSTAIELVGGGRTDETNSHGFHCQMRLNDSGSFSIKLINYRVWASCHFLQIAGPAQDLILGWADERGHTTGYVSAGLDVSRLGGRLIGREAASHVGDQRILKYCPELYNLELGQAQFRNCTCSLLQLIGHVSREDSGPFSFRNNSVLGHRSDATEY